MPLEFCYFRAPESEMGFLPGNRVCSLCGQHGRCFPFDNAPATARCVGCLRLGRFGFSHDTEAGLVTEESFIPHSEPDASPRRVFVVATGGEAVVDAVPLVHPQTPHVSKGAIAELRRTPGFSTWQEIVWPVHCDDFMAYLGLWGPEEFAGAAPEAEGRQLFLGMVDSALHGDWPEDREPRFGQNYVAFQCLHCQLRTATFDID